MFQFVFTQLISKKNKQTNDIKKQRAEKGSEINRCGKRIKQQTEDCAVKKKKRSFLFVQYKLSLSNTNTIKLNQHRYNQTHPITWRIFSLQYGGLFPPTYATTAHGAIHNHVFAPVLSPFQVPVGQVSYRYLPYTGSVKIIPVST